MKLRKGFYTMVIGEGVGESIHWVFLVVLSFLSAGLLAVGSTRHAGKVVVSRRSIYLLVVAAC